MNRRKVAAPNTCANCRYLAWGKEEGLDLCRKTGDGVDWATKTQQVCDAHERVDGDPRNPVREDLATREAAAFKLLEQAWQKLNNTGHRTDHDDEPGLCQGCVADTAFDTAMRQYLTARTAATTAGYVAVLVQRDTLHELRAALPGVRELAPGLVRDLAPALKGR